jgi:hypothetical protein
MSTSLARNIGNLGNVLSTSGNYATAATPPALDSSGNLSTTAFVKQSGRTFSNIFPYAVSSILTTAQIGGLVENTAGGITLTLPPISSSPKGATISFVNPLATGTMTIKGNGSDLITSPFSAAGLNTIVLYPFESLDIVSNSLNWFVTGYCQLNSPAFAAPTVSTTPGHFDNSTLVPNTAWSVARGLQFNNTSETVSTSTLTLTAANIGGSFYFNALASQTVTMPPVTGLITGASVTFMTSSGVTLTVNGTGTNLDVGNGVVASFSMPGANSVTMIYSTTAGTWTAYGVYPFNRSYLASQITNINTEISNEATTRSNEDSNLQTQITNLNNSLSANVTNLQNNINNEATNRVNGDNALAAEFQGTLQVNAVGYRTLIESGATGTEGSVIGIAGRPGSWLSCGGGQTSGNNWYMFVRIA